MGTSQSNPGPGGNSPLVPPWADDMPNLPLPAVPPMRFKPFRENLGNFLNSGDEDSLNKSLGHYANKGTGYGGGEVAARRMGNVTKTGGRLFGFLTGSSSDETGVGFNIKELDGIPCDMAIDRISQALLTKDGDSDKIRASLNQALSGALEGEEEFNSNLITEDLIIKTLVCYLTEAIFLQIVADGGKAWNKAATPTQTMNAEKALRGLINAVVDRRLYNLLDKNIRHYTQDQIVKLQRNVIVEVWEEWKEYK